MLCPKTGVSQVDIEIYGCNNLYTSSINDIENKKAHWLEKLIAPNVWSQRVKIESTNKDAEFLKLEKGIYRVAYSVRVKSSHLNDNAYTYKNIISEQIEIGECPNHSFSTISYNGQSIDIEVFPNPAINTVTVDINNFNSEWNGIIQILSLDGKILLNSKISADINSIDVSSLSSGAYILNLAVDNESIFGKKLIFLSK